jgi:hypothetical protein
MTVEVKPLAEITQEALALLCKQLGVANTIRFVNQFTRGYGNYTEERQRMFATMSLEEIVAEIERTRKQ